MANEGPSLTKATYDKKRPRRDPPSPARVEAARGEKKRDAAEARRFDKIIRAGPSALLLELGLASSEPKPPAPSVKRRRIA